MSSRLETTVNDAVRSTWTTSALGGSGTVQVISKIANFLLNFFVDLEWVVHAATDVLVHLLVGEVTKSQLAVHAVLLGSADDAASDDDGDIADAVDVGVEPVRSDLLIQKRGRESFAGSVDHVLRDVDSLAEDCTEANSREHVNVVALTWNELLVAVSQSWEWRTGRKEAFAVSVLDGVFEGTLGLAAGVGEREDDGAVVQLSHASQDLWGEGTADGRETHENGWLDVLDDFIKSLELLTVVVVTGEVELVIGELATVVSNKALRIDEPESLFGFLLGKTLFHEEFSELLGDTDTSRASTEEDSTLVLGSDARLLDGIDKTAEDDGSSTLNVIVEHGVGVLVTLEGREGVLPVFVLNDDAWPSLGESCHHLVEELLLLLSRDLGGAAAHIEWVVPELFVVGAEIHAERESLEWVDASTSTVESQLANTDAHATYTEIAESEDTGAISDNGDLDIVRPVLDDGVEVSTVRVAEVLQVRLAAACLTVK